MQLSPHRLRSVVHQKHALFRSDSGYIVNVAGDAVEMRHDHAEGPGSQCLHEAVDADRESLGIHIAHGDPETCPHGCGRH
jgi:hypothetical protein